MLATFQSRCVVLCSIFMIGLSVLSYRLIQIQIVDRHRYATSSRKAFQSTEILPALRGMIVDCRDEPLAKTIPVCTLFIDKNHLQDPKVASYGLACEEAAQSPGWANLSPEAQRRRIKAIRGEILDNNSAKDIVQRHMAYAIGILARPLGMRREELREKIESSKSMWFPIAKDIPEDVAENLREISDSHWIQGFKFRSGIKRWYTASNLATHLVGYTGEKEISKADGKTETRMVGQFGIEASMEEYLRGRDGYQKDCRDAYGMLIPGDFESLQPPVAGLNVQLTIDTNLQSIVEEELDASLSLYKAPRGAVILMNPKNGEILAMASRPHFDLNLKKNIAESSFNFATQAVYEPGSTFKIIATSAVLNEGLATPQTTVYCSNSPDDKLKIPDPHGYGNLTLEGVLAKSSNIGAYKFARQLGTKRFYDYVSKWGFGRKTGILTGGESSGIARNTNNAIDFSRASYGYSLNVTPLQMACAYTVIAGNGKLLKPKIVKALVANDGTVAQSFPTEVVSQVIKPETAKKMRAALEKVVAPSATAPLAAVPGYKVAGKTGTAKRHNPNGKGYLKNSYTVSFAGMLPANDPAFVCVVVIDDPQTDHVPRYGGTIAAPTFAKIATKVASYLSLHPSEEVLSQPIATATRQ